MGKAPWPKIAGAVCHTRVPGSFTCAAKFPTVSTTCQTTLHAASRSSPISNHYQAKRTNKQIACPTEIALASLDTCLFLLCGKLIPPAKKRVILPLRFDMTATQVPHILSSARSDDALDMRRWTCKYSRTFCSGVYHGNRHTTSVFLE